LITKWLYNDMGNINHLPIYLATHLLTTYISTHRPHLLTYLPITLDTYVPTNLPTYYLHVTNFLMSWLDFIKNLNVWCLVKWMCYHKYSTIMIKLPKQLQGTFSHKNIFGLCLVIELIGICHQTLDHHCQVG
jgi:hypothetical protein